MMRSHFLGRIQLLSQKVGVQRSLHNFPPPFEPLFNRSLLYRDRLAIADDKGEYTYSNLLGRSASLQVRLHDVLKGKSKQRISFLCPNDSQYVVAQWACWLGGNVAVPLFWGHPRPVLEYYVKDSQSAVLVAAKELVDRLHPIATDLNLPLLVIDPTEATEDVDLLRRKTDEWKRLKHKDAQILYTSGTTGPPKGVVTTHHNLFVQAAALIDAWEYSSSDVILHTLPLHHTHGIVNALVAPLYAGSTCVMLPKFDAAEVSTHDATRLQEVRILMKSVLLILRSFPYSNFSSYNYVLQKSLV